MSNLLSPPTLALPCPTFPHPIFFPSPPKLKHKRSLNSSMNPIHRQDPLLPTRPSSPPPHTTISPPQEQHPSLPQDWPRLLQISIDSEDLSLGLAIHALLLKSAPEISTFVGNNLINMYSKFNRLEDARRVLDEMPIRNTITWTSLINGYSNVHDFASVFRICQRMHRSGDKFNGHTCTVVLQACRSHEELIVGQQVHGMSIKMGTNSNVFVGTSLISMYARNGLLEEGELVLSESVDIDVRCLNSLILEYGKLGNGEKAIRAFCYMLESGLKPNDYTFTNAISACNGNVGVDEARQLQCLAIKFGAIYELSVGNAVITMYGRHGLVDEAERMFYEMKVRNLVSLTALLSAYVKNGDIERAIEWFVDMLHLGIGCDCSWFATVLDACSQNEDMELVSQIHCTIIKLGYLMDVFVATALVDAYAKCSSLMEARLVLDKLSHRSIASFNAILAGYLQTNGLEDDVMVLFNQLRLNGMAPDEVTIAQLLSLSADNTSFIRGGSLHAYAIKVGMGEKINVGNAVVSMYAKCGCIQDASQKFCEMVRLDLVTWNSMISAHALHGQGKEALLLFENMIQQGTLPDESTLVSILQACSYSGLLEEGIKIFKFIETYGIERQLDHQVCMVDLLGRLGDLAGAMEFIKGSNFKDSPLLWRTMMNACKLHGDFDYGMLASKHLLDLVTDDAASYILVSNMYSESGRMEEAAKVRVAMKDGSLRKEAGCSWIEVGGRVHRFTASGKDHSRSREIYQTLNELTRELKG